MDDLAYKLKNAIDRFLVEMPPFWEKSALERLLGDLTSKDVYRTLELLEKNGVIHLIKNDECYLILTEDYLRKNLPREFVKSGVARVQALLAQYPKPQPKG